MRTLTISPKEFTDMLSSLIASGVTFEAETKNGFVILTFTGGY